MVDITSGVNIGSGVWVGIDYSPASGGTVTTYSNGSNTFQVHTFSTSGTFVVRDTLTSASIVIAGGGGGGGGAYTTNYGGGAGGAGGWVPLTMTISPNSYSITVGTGGVGGLGGTGSGAPTDGTSSVAFGYTALGGGAGGQFLTPLSNAGSGGSGGGGYSKPAGNVSPFGLTLQNSTYGYGLGYDGESGGSGILSVGGGGGGANGDGDTIPPSVNTKNGIANSITGTQVYYCSGGGGGGPVGYSGTYPGPGCGGGGGEYFVGGQQTGTAGINGVVIIRYEI